jgi:hypothetical protein
VAGESRNPFDVRVGKHIGMVGAYALARFAERFEHAVGLKPSALSISTAVPK